MNFSTFQSQYETIANCRSIENAFYKLCHEENSPLIHILLTTFDFDIGRNFVIMCAMCNISAVQFASGLPGINIHYDNEAAFRSACKYRNLSIVQWLKTIWPDIDHTADQHDAFESSLESSFDQQCRYLISLYRADNVCSIIVMCLRRGRYDMLTYIIEYFDIHELSIGDEYQSQLDSAIDKYQSVHYATKTAKV